MHHTTTKGERLDFTKFKYLSEVYADTSVDISLVTGVQSGKTEWDVCDALSLISMGVAYQLVQPKDDLRVLFSRTRIDEPVERSPYYKAHVECLGKLYKWKRDKGAPGMLRVVFSNREDEMIAFPADCVGIDEVDKCDINNLALLPDRLLGSAYGLFRRTSTPTTTGNEMVQNIWWHYQQSDMREWFITCPVCGQEQTIDWLSNIVKEDRNKDTGKLVGYCLRDEDWNTELERDISAMCIICSNPLDRLGNGKYYPTAKVPTRNWKRGYHFNKLVSPLVPVSKMWDEYTKSTNNPVMMQRFSNSILGLPYIGAGTKLSQQMLYNCMEDYIVDPISDRNTYPSSMGVDVMPEYLCVRISIYPKPGMKTRKLVYAGRLKDFSDLHGLVERFNVRVCVIDAEPEGRESLRFQRESRCSTYVCYTRDKGSVELKDLELARVKQEKKFTIDRTLMMDAVLASYINYQQILPKNIAFLVEGKFVYEMTNPTRVLEVDSHTGREKFIWTHGADHCFLADVYDYCAGQLGNFHAVLSGLLGGQRPASLCISPLESLETFESMA
jgi:hypothetical protein